MFSLDFKVYGLFNVEVIIEMCFKEGSNIIGVILDEKKNYFFKFELGIFLMGLDKI